MKLILILVATIGLVLGKSTKFESIQVESRITNGKNVEDQREFKYQVSVQLLAVHNCGGCIISNLWILTAGHCVSDPLIKNVTDLTIKAGILSLGDIEHLQWKRVVYGVSHPNYTGEVEPNDIGLLKMDSPLVFNEYVQAITLPPANLISIGTSILSGWGATHPYLPKLAVILQYVILQIIPLDECKADFEKIKVSSNALAESNICTGPDHGKAACNGDSGGPLVIITNGTRILVGLVSWGVYPCGYDGAPSVYTRVSSFIDYISSVTNAT